MREGFREEAVARERKVERAHLRAQGAACLYKVGWEGVVCSLESGAAHCLDLPALQKGFLSGVVLTIHTPISIFLLTEEK